MVLSIADFMVSFMMERRVSLGSSSNLLPRVEAASLRAVSMAYPVKTEEAR